MNGRDLDRLLIKLINYLLQCLAYERRDSTSVPKNLLGRFLFPVGDSDQTSWVSLVDTPIVATIIEQIQSRPNSVVIYAPMLTITSQARVEPLVGILGIVSNKQLRLDPSTYPPAPLDKRAILYYNIDTLLQRRGSMQESAKTSENYYRIGRNCGVCVELL